MENVKVNVLENKPCEMSLSLEIGSLLVTQEEQTVFNQILQRAKIPGFRAGKAPLDVIKKTFQQEARQQILENLAGKIIPEVLREKNIRPVSHPRVEKLDFEFGKPLSLHLTVETQPELKVKDYKKIKLIKKIYTTTDDQVTAQLKILSDKNARLVGVADETVQKDHLVVVDYAGTIDGKPIPGAQAQNQLVDLNSSQMIQGFAEGIVGSRIGEERNVNVEFPAEYPQKEFAEKKAVFSIKVREIKKKISPPLDDEFAKDMGLKSLEELKQHICAELQKQALQKSEQEIKNQVIEHLLKTHVFQVPKSLVEEQQKILLERSRRLFLMQGYPEAAWEKHKDQAVDKVKEEAEKQVRLSYVLLQIANVEKIDVSENDFQSELNKEIANKKTQEKEIKQYYEKHKNAIIDNLKEAKIFKYIIDNAKIRVEKA